MGTAGLDLKRLSGLLERHKIDCLLLEDDHLRDHCLLRLTSVTRPNLVAMVEYENQGSEPRLVGMFITDEQNETLMQNPVINWEHELVLSGSRKSDVDKIVEWVLTKFV